jgi:hypothetical protein
VFNPDAALEINSVTGALLLPRMTTVERNALDASEGMLIYNTDFQKFQGFVGDSGTTTLAMSEVAMATYFIGDDGVNVTHLAQTFTPTKTGLLQTFAFNVSSLTPGFQLTLELYEGENPGTGNLLTAQTLTIDALAWNVATFAPNWILNAGTVYHVIIKPAMVSSNFIGILKSNKTPGEHEGGTLFFYNSSTMGYDASTIEDMDFIVNGLVNNRAWVNLH